MPVVSLSRDFSERLWTSSLLEKGLVQGQGIEAKINSIRKMIDVVPEAQSCG